MLNHAARMVLWVVSFVIVVYTLTDAYLCVREGKISEASRQLFNTALGALIGIIATTGRGGTPPGVPAGTPSDPISTEEVKP